ncbi:hypothetical protein ASPTUDRAFT_47627, partial [Aspergillus tubingensis CBS 134.48]
VETLRPRPGNDRRLVPLSEIILHLENWCWFDRGWVLYQAARAILGYDETYFPSFGMDGRRFRPQFALGTFILCAVKFSLCALAMLSSA